ncbi:hypothetical protein Thermo_00530 [Thermoplasmatales archaeon]|nr:hypothetical protein Thermo_00530 [Thermoplasmatales archaeon]
MDNLQGSVDLLKKHLEKGKEKLQEENRYLREQLDEYKKEHPSSIGEKNGTSFEIKPGIMPQHLKRRSPDRTMVTGILRKIARRRRSDCKGTGTLMPKLFTKLSRVQEMRERIIEDIPLPETIVTKYRKETRYCEHCKMVAESQIEDAFPNTRLSIRAMLAVNYLKIGKRVSG